MGGIVLEEGLVVPGYVMDDVVTGLMNLWSIVLPYHPFGYDIMPKNECVSTIFCSHRVHIFIRQSRMNWLLMNVMVT